VPRFAGTKFGGGGTPVVVPRWLDTTGQNFLGKKFPCLPAGRDFVQDRQPICKVCVFRLRIRYCPLPAGRQGFYSRQKPGGGEIVIHSKFS